MDGMSHPTTSSRSSFFPTGDSFETSDVATLLMLAGASDADKTGWGDRRGGRREHPALDWCPGVPSMSGDSGVAAPGPELCYCWAAGTSVLPQLLGMEPLPHSRRSPEGCQHFGRKFCMDPLPPSRATEPPGKAGQPGRPKPQTPELPKHSRHSLSPQTLCQPQTPCATGKLARSLCYSFRPLCSGSSGCVWCLYPGIPGYCADHTRGASHHWLTSSSRCCFHGQGMAQLLQFPLCQTVLVSPEMERTRHRVWEVKYPPENLQEEGWGWKAGKVP